MPDIQGPVGGNFANKLGAARSLTNNGAEATLNETRRNQLTMPGEQKAFAGNIAREQAKLGSSPKAQRVASNSIRRGALRDIKKGSGMFGTQKNEIYAIPPKTQISTGKELAKGQLTMNVDKNRANYGNPGNYPTNVIKHPYIG